MGRLEHRNGDVNDWPQKIFLQMVLQAFCDADSIGVL